MIKVGFLLEGWTDLLAFRVLTSRVLDQDIEVLEIRRRASGLHGVFAAVDRASWTFWRSGAVGAVLAVDNDDSPAVHSTAHSTPDEGCRTCSIRSRLPLLPERPVIGPLRFAIGVPVQALESWLLFGRGVVNPEAITKASLKKRLYGTEHPTRVATDPLVEEICRTVDLEALCAAAPSFARFAAELAAW